jgi:mRNA interferase MazF
VNIGVEQDGKWDDFSRPLVIVKKRNRHSFYALPLTSVDKSKSIHHVEIWDFEAHKQSSASLAQLKVVASKRLIEKKGMISKNDYKKLLEKIKELFS